MDFGASALCRIQEIPGLDLRLPPGSSGVLFSSILPGKRRVAGSSSQIPPSVGPINPQQNLNIRSSWACGSPGGPANEDERHSESRFPGLPLIKFDKVFRRSAISGL